MKGNMKGESQKRLSLATIEKAGLLFIALHGNEKSKGVPNFIWFLEKINDEGLPAVREEVKKQLGLNNES